MKLIKKSELEIQNDSSYKTIMFDKPEHFTQEQNVKIIYNKKENDETKIVVSVCR